MKKIALFVLVVALCAIATIASAEEATTYAIGITWNTKGLEGLDPDTETPSRVYSSDELKAPSTAWWKGTFSKTGFVAKRATAPADNAGLKTLQVSFVEKADAKGNLARVSAETTQECLDEIQAQLVRTVRTKKGLEGETTNVEAFNKKVHQVEFILHLEDGSVVKVFFRNTDPAEHRVLTLCYEANSIKRGTSTKRSSSTSTTAPATAERRVANKTISGKSPINDGGSTSSSGSNAPAAERRVAGPTISGKPAIGN